ncbi:MAG: GTP cyclohydrolase I FolE [candidate division KSB1 bacterium]|nr:GTP cyclohydrolase I FolE [candidate division KSB1 bacterium]MDZ7295102.1 GTP cyclohydrolase I FolE [candidate division KSB1 bacterium]MDZ7339149.1 GTP cyclohydrolase I FolE [candidate division KSB1 bacterium]MDZ7379552.1 GTP cyclohydrolase I FolE [candidate division KSB1 bacterium]MDZ7386535.1 GTP cyclohydrolase I FolE [candidate division KSB1 bacterium]
MAERIRELVEQLLRAVGEDPSRQGLKKTPERVERALAFLTQGYQQDPEEILQKAVFDEQYDEMVIVKDIELFSLCEHHLLPFFGRCHVGYLPKGKIVGVSKIPRVVDVYARRLQLQERLTTQIADALWRHLQPYGVAVVIEARHLCMMMRGVEKQNSVMTTSAMRGVFQSERATRMEFMELIRCHGG